MRAGYFLAAALLVSLSLPACAQNSQKSGRVIEKADPKSRPLEQEPMDAPKSRPLEQEPMDAPKSRPLEQEDPVETGRDGQRGGDGGDIVTGVAGAVLSSTERDILYGIFGGGSRLEGFSKPKPLPPGIRKKIARGGAIPPGIAMTRFPNSVYSRLPGRSSRDLVAIGDDIVLIDPTTKVILDVMEGILR